VSALPGRPGNGDQFLDRYRHSRGDAVQVARVEISTIAVGDKFILYRPLRRLAFVGNSTMARLVMGLAGDGPRSTTDLPPSILEYLQAIGFMEPDPPPPPPRQVEYRPTSAVLLSTNRCNLRCVYCYADAGAEAAQDVSLELARAAIDHVYQNTVELGQPQFELTFHGGGEPTLSWKTLVEATAYARAKDLPCHVSVVSNGIWTDRQREWIIPNLNELTISFDGARETQDRQRPFASGKSTFEAVMQTISTLDEQGFDYGIRMTALAPWRERLVRDVQFICQETGCKQIQVEPAFNAQRGEYQTPSWRESEDFVDGFMEGLEVAERAGRQLTYSGARPYVLTSSFCSAPYGSLVVTPAGELVSCYEITNPRHPLAEMCTIGRLEEGRVIVDQNRRSALLSRMASRREACRDCFCYWHCAGDCHVKAFYPGVDAAPVTSTRCQTNREITAQMLLRSIAAADDGVWRGDRGSRDGGDTYAPG
jgi:uncharacterized protein